jgi:hypothetical protein
MRLRRVLLVVLLLAVASQVGFAQVAGTVIPVPRAAFYDGNGNPCAGCKLYPTEAGTTTPLATYQESALTTPHAHPIVLDSAGRATIFLQALTYRFRLDSAADVTIWTVDGVAAVPGASGTVDIAATAGETLAATDVVYLADGTGGTTAGRWYKTDADNTYSSGGASLVGIAQAAIATGSSGTVRVAGRATGMTGLTSGESYFISATAGALTLTPPAAATSQRFLGAADSTTTFVLHGNPGNPRMPDSDGTHSLVLGTTSNLTADRGITLVPGDAARTLTLTGNATVNQDTSTTGAPSFNWAGPCDGRLTVSAGVPVPSGDVSAATSVYWTPYKGNTCYTYNGSGWDRLTFTELTQSLVGCTASLPYDVFLYNNAGVLATELLAWTNATTRATALVTQHGVYAKSGALTRRYAGTVYCNSAGGQTDDTVTLRFVWNYDNRVRRPMRRLEGADSWTYTTAAWRQANGSASNQLAVVIGVAEDAIAVRVNAVGDRDGFQCHIGVGKDATTALATGATSGSLLRNGGAGSPSVGAELVDAPAAGYHFYAWIEHSPTGGTCTFYGDNGGAGLIQSGMVLEVWG